MEADLAGIDAPLVARWAHGRDGTPLRYVVAGAGPRVWVLPPGLGTPFVAWKRLIERFADEMTIVTWAGRGTYASGVPADLGRLRVEDHADDLEAVVAAEGLDRYALGGWSLAVQIALEHHHRHPGRATHLLLLNGAYEHILKTALAPGLEPALRAYVRGLAFVGGPLRGPLSRATALGAKLLPRLGLARRDAPLLEATVRAFASLDWAVYFRMMGLVNEHSAAAYLDEVRLPTLITAGDADRMTPLATAEAMHRRIPGSELVVLPGGTHYTPVELPDELNDVIADFFARHPEV
ncbi:MAG: alpha/beta hydrolase [Deltaproteobacteria bacterium]|nr:alpha/beta hydrolase [Deltaproteobacteria bacterium]